MDSACVICGKVAVTRDGRSLCLAWLRRVIARETPMIGCYRGLGRTAEHREARDRGPSPSQENAIRALEGE